MQFTNKAKLIVRVQMMSNMSGLQLRHTYTSMLPFKIKFVPGRHVFSIQISFFHPLRPFCYFFRVGAALLPIISIEFEDFNPGLSLSDSAKQGYFILALITIAIGTGGIKANIGPFGAQQLDDLGENAIQTFFNW